MDINGKIAIVTGASAGIGYETAKLLGQAGAKLALVARTKSKLELLAAELPGSLPVPADMTDEAAIRAMVEAVYKKFGRIDILVNNAGRGYDCPVEFIDTEKYRLNIQLNVIGPLVAMQSVIPVMRKQGGGSIVNISSGTALMYLPTMAAYSSTKRALGGITLTARQELANDKIAVSIVYPYITLTDFEKNTLKCAIPADEENEDGNGRPPADTAQFVAQKIVDVILTGAAEQYVHDWMKR
ncbi:MAG: SDR family oxidoreductase [Endomicrobiales bacterium]